MGESGRWCEYDFAKFVGDMPKETVLIAVFRISVVWTDFSPCSSFACSGGSLMVTTSHRSEECVPLHMKCSCSSTSFKDLDFFKEGISQLVSPNFSWNLLTGQVKQTLHLALVIGKPAITRAASPSQKFCQAMGSPENVGCSDWGEVSGDDSLVLLNDCTVTLSFNSLRFISINVLLTVVFERGNCCE
ncbi:Hypothetical predicted protein, partial [Paramuricea clavata]